MSPPFLAGISRRLGGGISSTYFRLGRGKDFGEGHRLNKKGYADFIANEDRLLKATEAPLRSGESVIRDFDAEAKILERLFRKSSPTSKGAVHLFSNWTVCPSCGDMIVKFSKQRPGILVRVFDDGRKTVSEWLDGKLLRSTKL